MSATVDERVVEMRFDNKDFEKNVNTSLSTIDKLKRSLNFNGATKGLENIGAAAGKVNMSGLGRAVEGVRDRFSALEVMGVTALVNITNSAVNAGKRIVKALTIDPVKTGFSEYETQINAVQTILANTSSKGTTLDDVNAALDELNKYADMTIYNFTEMTKNIGTFTAAGVDLDTSTNAIKGIANLAAVSGSTSQQASTAMYQLSQAMAAGTVKLMDWNSVVNAGMGGQVFQDALKETARAHGIAIDNIIAKNGSFRESLKDGWLSTEVLTDTLEKFTLATEGLTEEQIKANREMLKAKGYTDAQIDGIFKLGNTATNAATKVKTFTQLWDVLKEAAQSGWTQTWEILVGDFEEAKGLFTELSDTFTGIINSASEARNNMLDGAMTSNWSKLVKQVNAAGIETDKFEKSLLQVAKSHGLVTDEMIAEEGAFDKALKKGIFTKEVVIETLNTIAKVTSKTSATTADMTDKLDYFQKVVDKVWNGDYGNEGARIKALTEAGYDYAKVQDLVNKTVDGHRLTLEDLSDAQLKSVGYTDEQVSAIRELAKEAEKSGTPINKLIEDLNKPSGRELLIDSLRNALQGILAVCKSVKNAWDDAFPPMTSDRLYEIVEGIHKLSKGFVVSEDTADKLTRTFKGLFAIIDIITTITGGVFKMAIKTLCKLLGMADVDVLAFTASIGDTIAAFRDWLLVDNLVVKGLNKLIDIIKKAVDVVRNLFRSFMELPVVQKNIERIGNAFSATFKDLTKYVDDGGERIGAFISRIQAMDSITLDDLDDIFDDFQKNVVGYFFNVEGKFTDIGDAISAFKSDLKVHFSEAGVVVDELKNKITNFAISVKENISENIVGVLAITAGVGVVAAIGDIHNAVKTLAGPVEGLTKFLDRLGKSIQGFLNAKAFETRADGIKTMAVAIAILAGSVAVLAMIPSEQLWGAVKAIAALAGVLLAFSTLGALVSRIAGGGGTVKMTVPILALSASLLIFVTALKQMESLKTESISNNVHNLGVIMVTFGVISGILARVAPQLSKGSISMLAFATSIRILVDALVSMDVNKAEENMLQFIGVVSSLVLVSVACNGLSFGSAAGVLAIVVALKLLIAAFEDMTELDTYAVMSSLDAFLLIFATMGIVARMSRRAGKHAAKAGASVLLMSGAMIVLVQAIKMMSSMESADLDAATNTISKLLLVFAAVTAVSKLAGEHAVKAGIMLIAMAGAITILTGVIWLLSKIEPEGLKRGVSAVMMLEFMFGILIAVTKLAQNCLGTLIALTAAAATLATAVGLLSKIEPERLSAAAQALSLVIASFAVLVASSKLVQKVSGTLIVMGAIVGILALILGKIASMGDLSSTIDIATSLSLLLLAMSASMVIISKVGAVTPMALVAVAGMFAVVAGLAILLTKLGMMDVNSSLEIAASLSLLLLSLSAACLMMIPFGASAPLALTGVLAFIGVVAALGTLMVAIGTLSFAYPELEFVLDKAIPVLEKIGYAIGAIFGGAFAGLTAGLPEIGENFAKFSDNISGINTEALTGAKALAETILILSAADLINGLTAWFTGGVSYRSIGANLVELAKAMKEFSIEMNGVEVAPIVRGAAAANALAKVLENVPNTGGLLGAIVGDNTWDKFAEGLGDFGAALKTYSIAVKGMDTNAVKNSATAAKALAELNDNLPNSGGVLAYWVGDNTWDTFAEGLVSFGISLNSYSKVVKGVDSSAVTNSVTAAQALAGLNNNLPNSGGKLADWIGDNTWRTFGDGLVVFGKDLKAYASEVTGLDATVVTNSALAAESLASLEQKLPNSGGVLAELIGDNTLRSFGQSLKTFGVLFVEYSDLMSQVNPDVLNTTTKAAQTLITLENSLSENKLFKDESKIDDFGAALKDYGKDFTKYYEEVSTVDCTTLLKIIITTNKLMDMITRMGLVNTNTMSTFGAALTSLGNTGISGFISAFDNSDTRIAQAVSGMFATVTRIVNQQKGILLTAFTSVTTNIVRTFNNMFTTITRVTNQQKGVLMSAFTSLTTNILGLITNKHVSFQNAGVGLMVKFAMGLKSKTSAISSSFATPLSSAIESIKKYKDKFYSCGSYVVDGFASGISENIYKVKAKATAMAEAALEAAREALDINSPSKETYTIGEYTGEGFVNGLGSFINKSADMGSGIGSGFVDGLKGVGKKVADTAGGIGDAAKKSAEEAIAKIFTATSNVEDHVDVPTTVSVDSDAVAEEVTKTVSELDKFKAALDDKKYYNKITLEEELAEWQKMQKKYAEGSEERKEIDREVYRVQNELYKTVYNDAIALIDDKKYYDQMSRIAELAAWKRMQKEYAEGTEERKKADKEVYRLQKEINKANEDHYKEVQKLHEETAEKKMGLEEEYYDKTKEINDKLMDDIQRVNDEYDNALKSRTDSLYKSYGLFDKVETPEAKDGDTLLANLQSQVDAFTSWQGNINGLASRGIDETLLEELREMGPSAAAEIAGLNAMSDEQLNAYVNLWKQKYNLAKSQATTELKGLRAESDAEIVGLRNDAAAELSAYKEEWNTRMSELVTDSEQRLTELRNTWKDNLGILRTETESEFTTMSKNITTIIGDETSWSEQGVNIVEGLLGGIVDNSDVLMNGISTVMTNALNAAKQALGIHSPSREFAKLGMYADQGFALGLNDFTSVVTTAAADVGNESIRSLSGVISKIADYVSDGIDTTPVIRPVVDLTEFDRSKKLMDHSLGGIEHISVKSSYVKAHSLSASMQSSNRGINDNILGNQNGTTVSFTQNNYSPKALSRIDIYRQTKNQFSAIERMVTT